MKHSFIPLAKPEFSNIEKKLVNDCLNTGWISSIGKYVQEFADNLAQFSNVKYVLPVSNGTAALHLALIALDIGPGDEVIVPALTFVASANTVTYVGAKPVFVDIEPDTFNLDLTKLESVITKKTKAIIPIYLNGRICNMKKIMDIAQKHNLIVIEDSAQALGAEFKGKKAGSIGLTGCFSFYPAKILGCFGDGGAITTNNLEIAEKVRLLRDHGQKTKTEIVCYGWNSRLDNFQAAVLNIRLKYLSKWIKRRREIAEIYNKGLSDIKEIILPLVPDSDKKHFDVYQNYVLRAEKRDKLFNFLKEKGIEALIKDPIPNHWHKGLNLYHFKLPLTEQMAKEVISLPMYPELTDDQIEYIISCITGFYKN